jgi:hypothetical protein
MYFNPMCRIEITKIPTDRSKQSASRLECLVSNRQQIWLWVWLTRFSPKCQLIVKFSSRQQQVFPACNDGVAVGRPDTEHFPLCRVTGHWEKFPTDRKPLDCRRWPAPSGLPLWVVLEHSRISGGIWLA